MIETIQSGLLAPFCPDTWLSLRRTGGSTKDGISKLDLGAQTWLSTEELNFLKVMFQKRHLLEHNNGMVDQKYIDNSNDTSYSVGQRIVVKDKDAYALLGVLRKLGEGLVLI